MRVVAHLLAKICRWGGVDRAKKSFVPQSPSSSKEAPPFQTYPGQLEHVCACIRASSHLKGEEAPVGLFLQRLSFRTSFFLSPFNPSLHLLLPRRSMGGNAVETAEGGNVSPRLQLQGATGPSFLSQPRQATAGIPSSFGNWLKRALDGTPALGDQHQGQLPAPILPAPPPRVLTPGAR
ncbi:hypothetical protein L345_02212, partial [Ophiophagus hannah]